MTTDAGRPRREKREDRMTNGKTEIDVSKDPGWADGRTLGDRIAAMEPRKPVPPSDPQEREAYDLMVTYLRLASRALVRGDIAGAAQTAHHAAYLLGVCDAAAPQRPKPGREARKRRCA